MSKRREIEANLGSLGDIRDILNAMKNMARMEVQRLGRFLAVQQRVVAGIEAAASDFLAFNPGLFPHEERSREIRLVLGSERGFCGDFNEALLRALDEYQGQGDAAIVVLGSKLKTKLPDNIRPATFLEGASTGEEVEDVLVRLMDALSGLSGSSVDLRERTQCLRVTIFHHTIQHADVRVSVLHPFQEPVAASKRFAYPPFLYLDPVAFAHGVIELYLFARLHELLYSSLMYENQVRIQHMDSAVERIEKKSTQLLRRRNILRQEEITEEIEVIMLNSEM